MPVISATGMNRSKNMPCLNRNGGFTLIELVVVMALIGIFFAVTLPRFDIGVNKTDKFSRWFIVKVDSLKKRAAADKKNYILRIDMDEEKIYVADDSMSEEAMEAAAESGYEIPESVTILDVEFAKKDPISSGVADIRFYEKGYSDKVIVHIEDDDDNQKTFIIEPFLPRIKLVEDYVDFAG